MKLKILIFPISIFIALVVSIWVIWPGIQSAQALSGEIKGKKNLLEELKKKKTTITKLNEQIQSDEAMAQTVVKFVPQESEEEKIVKAIDSLANNAGGFLVTVNMEDTKEQGKVTSREDKDKEIELEKKSVLATIEFVSTYENSRNFLKSLYQLERMHRVTGYEIAAQEEEIEGVEGGQSQVVVNPDALKTVAEVEVVYAPKIKLETGIKALEHSALKETSFNTDVITEIGQLAKGIIPKIIIDSSGRENPFKK
ncbi:MAG: hypothetical protein KC736_03030 [Candidatus Moranbacteria bacterium]|nr:hypothetical protein [Candidatus Moranbacteria bacterium]